MARGKTTFKKCAVTNCGYYQDWSPKNINTRVGSNGGKYSQKLTSETTHLVVTQKAWRAQGPMIREALQLNREFDQGIKIVSFDWLDDRWKSNSTNKNDNIYLWERLEPVKTGGSKKGQKKPTTDDEESTDDDETTKARSSKEVEGPKSHAGMMGEVLKESTEQYVDERAKKAMDKKVEAHRRVREEMAAEERRDAALKAAAFQKGAKKARNEIFSDNHHIYTDETNFKYDVILTKVDTKNNRNERWILTIYESNTEPYTYAMNAQFSGTNLRPANNVMAAMGCNFQTAFRSFKAAFKEYTRVDWEQRISHAIERQKREKRNRGLGTGSEEGTQRGVHVSESAIAQSKTPEQEDFTTAPFQYHPPAYGPRGVLPESEKEKLAAAAPPPSDRREKVDMWMTGGNDSGAGNVAMSNTPDDALDLDFSIGGTLPDISNQDGNQDLGTTAGAIDLTSSYDYPFQSDDIGTDQDGPMQQDSFHDSAELPDSFDFGAQTIGETQMATDALGDFEEYFNQAGNGGFSGSSGRVEPTVDFGPSILGKRKSPSSDESQEREKSLKTVEDEDTVPDESPLVAPTGGDTDDGHLELFGEKESEVADSQLVAETQA